MIKLNNGNGAIVCDKCRTVIRTGFDNNNYHLCDKCSCINNFAVIYKLMKNKDVDYFYFCQIIQHKKDGNDIKDSNVIKSYYFYDKDQLKNKETEIISLCKQYNARAYINLNLRNRKEVLTACIHDYIDMLIDKVPFSFNVLDSCCGKCGENTTFLIDVDEDIDDVILHDILHECRGSGGILGKLNTPNGYHLITTRFDRKEFMQKLAIKQISGVMVKSNSPTLLYYDLSGK